MYINNSYLPFLETSTRLVNGYKINVYNIYSCVLYPHMSKPSLLHISGIQQTTDNRVLLVSDDNDTAVCHITLINDGYTYAGYAWDSMGYCGELELSKEAFNAFNDIPLNSVFDNDSFVFDPTCVKYRPVHVVANAIVDNSVITGITADIGEDGMFELVDGVLTVRRNSDSTDTRNPIRTINNSYKLNKLIMIAKPSSTIRVVTDHEGIKVGRLADL